MAKCNIGGKTYTLNDLGKVTVTGPKGKKMQVTHEFIKKAQKRVGELKNLEHKTKGWEEKARIRLALKEVEGYVTEKSNQTD